jgi:hypothetical protein
VRKHPIDDEIDRGQDENGCCPNAGHEILRYVNPKGINGFQRDKEDTSEQSVSGPLEVM